MANKDVQINVSSTSKPSPWTEVTASDGTTKFWYMWVGGNVRPSATPNGIGNNEFNVDNVTRTFDVTFVGKDSSSYKFTAFKNKTESTPNQITGSVATGGTSITVTDLCTVVEDYEWGATIETTSLSSNVSFDADPVISNRRIERFKE